MRKQQNSSNISNMKYLTMILALSPSVMGFTGLKQTSRPSTAASLAASSTTSCRIPRNKNRSAATQPSSDFTASSQLYYISDRSSELAHPNHPHNWWNNIFGGQDENNAADDYLEFLDKRYNRILHDEDGSASSRGTGFPVLNWLYQTDESPVPQKQKEDDALYVLGVANLASKKLLQKHQLLPDNDDPTGVSLKDETAVDVLAEDVGPSAAVSKLFREVAHTREVFLRRQMRYTRLALAFLVRTLLTAPITAVRKVYVMGGGHKTFALTLTGIAALSFLLRPAAKMAVSDATGGALSP